jgi:hypothetical protein
METKYLLGTDPANPDLCQYIIRLSPPITFMTILNMNHHDPVVHEKYITKDYTRDDTNEVFQIAVLPVQDGISDFYLNSLSELEWIMDDGWKWFRSL